MKQRTAHLTSCHRKIFRCRGIEFFCKFLSVFRPFDIRKCRAIDYYADILPADDATYRVNVGNIKYFGVHGDRISGKLAQHRALLLSGFSDVGEDKAVFRFQGSYSEFIAKLTVGTGNQNSHCAYKSSLKSNKQSQSFNMG